MSEAEDRAAAPCAVVGAKRMPPTPGEPRGLVPVPVLPRAVFWGYPAREASEREKTRPKERESRARRERRSERPKDRVEKPLAGRSEAESKPPARAGVVVPLRSAAAGPVRRGGGPPGRSVAGEARRSLVPFPPGLKPGPAWPGVFPAVGLVPGGRQPGVDAAGVFPRPLPESPQPRARPGRPAAVAAPASPAPADLVCQRVRVGRAAAGHPRPGPGLRRVAAGGSVTAVARSAVAPGWRHPVPAAPVVEVVPLPRP